MARTYSRDSAGRFGAKGKGAGVKNKLQDKQKKKRTLKEQRDTLKGRPAKKGKNTSRKTPAGDKVTNKQQKKAFAKTKRRANGGK